jgi:serine/threonine-protein kinase
MPRSGPWVMGEVVAERYELLAPLGEGLSGSVFRARDLYVGADPEIVAVKLIHGELLGDKQIAGRFRREAAVLKRLAGPHLCPLLDIVEEDGMLLLAIEYIDGPSLERYLQARQSLPLEEIVALVGQICAALEVAHEAGVVHRDLKPSNVLVEGGNRDSERSFTRELAARVVDFGLAKLLQGDGDEPALTERNMIFGTPEYMAPEQVAGEAIDARADIYALGVLLYRLVSGRLPFERDGALATMKAHLSEEVPSLRDVAPEGLIGLCVEQVVMKALEKAAKDRYPTARELGDALVRAAERDRSDRPRSSRDTELDVAASPTTTMQSRRDEGNFKPRGGKVQVVVPESTPSTARSGLVPAARASERDRKSGRGTSGNRVKSSTPTRRAGKEDGRVWAVIALLAALGAIAAGVWFGLG